MEDAVSQIRRIQRWSKPWLVAALVVLLAGCGSENQDGASAPTGFGGGDASFDGVEGGGGGGGGTGNRGVTINGNLEVVDQNPTATLVADPARSGFDAVTAGGMSTPGEYAAFAAACYETPDACSAPGCSVFATCCVDNGTCCKPIDDPPLPVEIDFRGCDDLDTCAADNNTAAVVFAGQPVINNRGLVPGGNASSESGAIIGDPVDLGTTRVHVDVEFALPIGCGGSCLESAGVTFSSTTPGTFVDAEVGLLLSGSRNEVNLMIGGAVADTFDAGSDQTRWSLISSPEGRVEVLRNDIVQGAHPFDASALRQASLILFGRNLSEEQNSAAISRIAVQTSFCDIPSSWDVRDPVVITDDVNDPLPGERFGRGPSVAIGQEVRFAYGIDDEIFWGAGDVGSVQLISTSAALSPSYAHEALGVEDPELVYDGNDWHVFYTALDQNGVGSIGHATATPAETFAADPNPTLSPSGDAVSLDAPTVHRRAGLWVLIARATLASGATELRAYYTSALNTGWERVAGSSLEALTRVENPGSEITGPSLVVHNSAYQLYFAKRSGTRWAAELLTSDELLLWRPLGEVLGPSGEGFDQLGARAPDAISLTDRIELVYEGQNGVSFELGWAGRPAPSDTASDF
jgi:hypothetical protein